MRLSRGLLGTGIVSAVLLTLSVTLSACGSVAEQTSSNAQTSIEIPENQFLEVYRSPNGQRVWETWIDGDYIIWVEALAPGNTAALGYSQAAQYGTCLRYLRLGSVVNEVAGSVVKPPSEDNPQLPVSKTALLPGPPGEEPQVVWTTGLGLKRWSPSGKTETVLPDTLKLDNPIASGDVIALPVVRETADSATTTGGGSPEPRLLMMTSNLKQPVSVNPAAPQLPASVLSGLSPYFAFPSGEYDFGDLDQPAVYDLRNGKRLDLSIPVWPATVGGHYAVWSTVTGATATIDVGQNTLTNQYATFLADLDTLTTRQIASGLEVNFEWPSVAVNDEWLVTLERGVANGVVSASEDVVAYHLPDMSEVRIASALGPDETGGLQLSGNRLLLTVWKGLSDVPHDDPDWTALRVTDLSRG